MLEETVLVFDSSRRVDNLDRLSNNEQAIQQGKYYFCWNNHTPPPPQIRKSAQKYPH